VELSEDGSMEIAKRSRGTPRIANRLLRRVRDFASVGNKKVIDREIVNDSLNRLDVDYLGLDRHGPAHPEEDRERFRRGPVGAETLAVTVSEEVETIEDVYEPYLIQIGFINRTPRGRVSTKAAVEHLQKMKEI